MKVFHPLGRLTFLCSRSAAGAKKSKQKKHAPVASGLLAWHWLPIVRLTTLLHLIQLVPRFSPSIFWKRAQVIEEPPQTRWAYGFVPCARQYKILYKMSKRLLSITRRFAGRGMR